MRVATYNIGIQQITESVTVWSWAPYYIKGSITLSDFIGSTNERRLYMVVCGGGAKSSDTLRVDYFHGPDWRHEDVFWTACGAYPTIGEVELASDNTFMAFTQPFATVSNQGQFIFLTLNTDGTFDDMIHYNADITFTKHYMGLEISANNNTIYTNSMGIGFNSLNVSNLNNIAISGTFLNSNYSNSQIERASNGKYYVVKADGSMGWLNFTSGTVVPEFSLGSGAIINNELHSASSYQPYNMYLIPDQIDGCEYDYTTDNNITCCYSYTEMPVVNTMGGSVAVASGNLKVLTDVTWTPTNNPFTTGSSTPEIYFRGDIIVEPGAKLTINDMTIYMDDGKKNILNKQYRRRQRL